MNFKEGDKQQILEYTSVKDKLYAFFNFLVHEIEIIKTEKEISDKVKASVEKSQREYYLRERLKAIHSELGDDEDEREKLKQRIIDKKLPKAVEEKALKEFSRMDKMSPSSPDYTVLSGYLDWILDLPFNEESKDRESLSDAKKILEEDHYGLEKVKERIIEYLAVLKLTGKIGGSILCLYGPPGVGKTSIAKSVARALDRKFVRMSLGGVKDEAEIRGHRKTYVGAMPGRIIYAMKEAGTVGGIKKSSTSAEIYNDGDGECGITVTIRAKGGSVVNPAAAMGGKKIRCLLTLADGDVLIIDGRSRIKKLYKNGESVFCFDKDSVFFSLPAGKSTLNILCDSGSEYIEAGVRFTPVYFGM